MEFTIGTRKIKAVHILGLILLTGLLFRMWGITNPLLDFHHFRQTYTALYAKQFYSSSMNLFRPTLGIYNYINISEFQIYPFLVALLYKIFGFHDIIGRLVSIAFSMGTIFAIYRLGERYFSALTGLIAATLYAILPMAVFYTRTFMLESMLIFFSVMSIYLLTLWLDNNKRSTMVLAILFTAMALLITIPSAYLGLPIAFLFLNRYGIGALKRISFYIFGVFSVAPAIYWYFIHPHLFSGGVLDERTGNMYLRPEVLNLYLLQLKDLSTYQKMIFSRIGEYILTIPGFLFLIAAMVLDAIHFFREKRHGSEGGNLTLDTEHLSARKDQDQRLFYWWIAGFMMFVFGFITMNLIHEYYQLPLIPPAAIIIGAYLEKVVRKFISHRTWQTGTIFGFHLFLFLLIVPISVARVASRLEMDFTYYDISKLLKERSNPEDIIISVDPQPRTEVFYFTERNGYLLMVPEMSALGAVLYTKDSEPRIISEIEKFRSKGARYLIEPYREFAHLFPHVMVYLNANYKLIHEAGAEKTSLKKGTGFVYDLGPATPVVPENIDTGRQ